MKMFENTKGILLTYVISTDIEPIAWGQISRPSDSILECILDLYIGDSIVSTKVEDDMMPLRPSLTTGMEELTET